MPYTSHTIYFGTLQTTVGVTIRPTPSLTLDELHKLIAELQAIHDDMEARTSMLADQGEWKR